ncbi:MAG: riboflavin synthase [Phormidesmis priestleyi]|uniref:Riboflavin synthase n=1 Tax=Phormidesmis priestleyi TaxID=268141 RepID=A0A2W4ZQI6_9CYAN|nr:MAG: riboflavin synthase [Phormidesmis priestleyi]
MFTGLVQSIGQLQHLGPYQLKITCATSRDRILTDIAFGDSIAVDGVCLTVEKILSNGFVASASPETLNKSTLGKVLDNGYVNLEPSLRVGSKIGGHFVTGHVDGTAQLDRAERVANAWEISFKHLSPQAARYIVSKGSVAVNGISLTVADCSLSGDWFSAAVIPVTYTDTNLQYLQSGDWVNLEGDVLGKYVEKFVRVGAKANPAQADAGSAADPSLAFLVEHGYV